MTMLTGKSRMTRHIEKVHAQQFKPSLEIIYNLRGELGIEGKEEHIAAANFICTQNAINQFVTMYLRSQLDLHPKWTTQSTFRDEAPACIAVIWAFVHSSVDGEQRLHHLKVNKLIEFMTFGNTTVNFNDCLNNMFKHCDLQRMVQRYPDETRKGLNIMIAMFEQFCVEQNRGVADAVNLSMHLIHIGNAWFPNWNITSAGVVEAS